VGLGIVLAKSAHRHLTREVNQVTMIVDISELAVLPEDDRRLAVLGR
jgi:hypothetical protein